MSQHLPVPVLSASLGKRVVNQGQVPAAVTLSSGDVGQLAAIREPQIGLTIWWRAAPVAVSMDDLAGFHEIRVETDSGTIAETLLAKFAALPHADWHAGVAADAASLGATLSDITGCSRARVRLDPITSNACRKFHADNVTVRLLTTYVGPGTEWQIDGDPVIHRLSAGDVGIFKGRRWEPNLRLLHRSPPIEGSGDRRLLLVIDSLNEDKGAFE